MLPHRGSHVKEYHEMVLSRMKRAANEAGNNRDKFLELYEKYVKAPIRENPDLMYKKGWGR